MITPIKIILATLLLLCLLQMPYGYYQFVRFAATVGFGYLALQANEKSNSNKVFIYLALALLFQPFFKVAFGRTIWNIVDVIIALELLFSVRNEYRKN